MYNSDEIYAMLRDGATSDELAKSFSDALNEAIKRKKEDDEAKYLEREKIDWLINVLEDTNEWVEEYYPEVMSNEEEDYEKTAKSIIKMMDGLVKTLKTINSSDKEAFSGIDGLLKGFGLL